MSQVIVVASIGRCIGSDPMTPDGWLAFKTDLIQVVESLSTTLLQRPLLTLTEPTEDTQVGVWANVACESAAVVMSIVEFDNVPRLRSLLSLLAHQYRQDAIGLIVHNAGTDSLCLAAASVADV